MVPYPGTEIEKNKNINVDAYAWNELLVLKIIEYFYRFPCEN